MVASSNEVLARQNPLRLIRHVVLDNLILANLPHPRPSLAVALRFPSTGRPPTAGRALHGHFSGYPQTARLLGRWQRTQRSEVGCGAMWCIFVVFYRRADGLAAASDARCCFKRWCCCCVCFHDPALSSRCKRFEMSMAFVQSTFCWGESAESSLSPTLSECSFPPLAQNSSGMRTPLPPLLLLLSLSWYVFANLCYALLLLLLSRSIYRMVLVAVWELRMFLPESLMLAHLMDTFMAHVSQHFIRHRFTHRFCLSGQTRKETGDGKGRFS